MWLVVVPKMSRKWSTVKKTLKKPFSKATKSRDSLKSTKWDDSSGATPPLSPMPPIRTEETPIRSFQVVAANLQHASDGANVSSVRTLNKHTSRTTKEIPPSGSLSSAESIFTTSVISGKKPSIGSYSIAKYPIENISSRRASFTKSTKNEIPSDESSITSELSISPSTPSFTAEVDGTSVPPQPILTTPPLAKKMRKTSSSSSSSHKVKFASTKEDALADFERLPSDNIKTTTGFIAMCSGAAMMPRKVFEPQLLAKSHDVPDAFKQADLHGGADDINFDKMAMLFHIMMCLPEDAFPTCTHSSRKNYASTIGGYRDLMAYGRHGSVPGDVRRTRALRKMYKRVSCVNLSEAREIFAEKIPAVVIARDTTKASTCRYKLNMILSWLAIPLWILSAMFFAAVVFGFFHEAANSFALEGDSNLRGIFQNDMGKCVNVVHPDLNWRLPSKAGQSG